PAGTTLQASLMGPDGRTVPLALAPYGQVSLHAGHEAGHEAAPAAPGAAADSMPGMDMSATGGSMPGMEMPETTGNAAAVEAVAGHSHGPAYTWRARVNLTPGAWMLHVLLSDPQTGAHGGAIDLNPQPTAPNPVVLIAMLLVSLGAMAYGAVLKPAVPAKEPA
ncbi:MAG TPA: hypothetical protein VHN99_01525, partial [Deinococcales bacterium]|nr:hypothetical protein [Deinococcales bacterium]